MTYRLRSLDELVHREEPAWPLVRDWIATATNPVEVLPPSLRAPNELVAMQVTTRSPLGALIFETGGILIDHGWLRILGSGHERLPRALADWNFRCGLESSASPPPFVLVADDVLGGFFAINGGRFAPDGNTVWYFAPDTLEWEDTKKSYSDFVLFCLTGDLEKFYSPYRWAGWQEEVRSLAGDLAFSIIPPLFAAGEDIGARLRKPVPIEELFGLFVGAA